MSFTSIPILDLGLARDPATKPAFLDKLRLALMEVGFFYIKNVGIPEEVFQQVIKQGKSFFDISKEEKMKMEMKNVSSFLGYSQLSAEITAGHVDHREQIDLASEHPHPGPDAPRYYNLFSPNQWPSEESAPGFRSTYTNYIQRMAEIAIYVTSLIAEAIKLPKNAFEKYFDPDPHFRLKIVKYPDVQELGLPEGTQGQGVGPHKDSVLSSFLIQATSHRGLQVQNMQGQWIDCEPVDGTLVVNIGQAMEALTGGVCVATTHRVLSPAAGAGARFSIPFFQSVRFDADFDEMETVGIGNIPQEIIEQRRLIAARNGGRIDDVEFTFRSGSAAKTLGEALLRNRVKSHPDVGARWYPDILMSIREEQAQAAKRQPVS